MLPTAKYYLKDLKRHSRDQAVSQKSRSQWTKRLGFDGTSIMHGDVPTDQVLVCSKYPMYSSLQLFGNISRAETLIIEK